MTEARLKPWQIDDPSDGELEPAAACKASTPALSTSPPSGSSGARAELPIPRTDAGHGRIPLNISSSWAIVPIAAALVLSFVAPAQGDGVNGRQKWARWLTVGCIGAAGAVLCASVVARRRASGRILGALERVGEGQEDAISVPAELKPVWQAVEQYVRLVGQRASDLADMHRKMQLDLTLAETNRRRTIAIINAMTDPVIVTDAFDQVTLINPSAAELLGVTAQSAMRAPIDTVIPDGEIVKTIKESRAADARAADRRKDHAIGERVFSVAATPVGSRSGDEGHSVVTIFRDITREHEASRNKSDFVSHVAHELRTPLSSIRAYVEMLVDGEAEDPDTRREYYDIIQTSAERLGRLIDNMLNISRIEAGTVRIHREPIGVSLIVKEAADMMKPSAEEKNIELTTELTPVMYRVEADRDLLYQAILNLISNAVKYTPEGGRVVVRMTPQEEWKRMLIEVEDSGAGIPKEDLSKMFTKFFRVEANKKLAKGTGLGLNLVKKIVEDVHGGEISLRSEVGSGSTFTIGLPLMV